jgi:hypothetical protein
LTIHHIFPIAPIYNIFYVKKILFDFKDIIALSEVYNPFFDGANRKELGFSLEETMDKCIFNKQPCSIEDFEW